MFVELLCDHCGWPYLREARAFKYQPGHTRHFCSVSCMLYAQIGWEQLGRERALAERTSERLDERAEFRRLSEWERFVQTSCRDRFGIYEPTAQAQAVYISLLIRDRTVAA